MPMLAIDTVGRDLTSRPIEALIADVSLVSASDLPRIVKTLGPNRPLVLVGDPKEAIEEVPCWATWIDRPVTRDTFLLSIALALAEGRPARRSPSPAVLPPYFTLRVPSFGVAAKVKRVWVAMPAQGSMWCGGIVERQADKNAAAWNKFVVNAPGSGEIVHIPSLT
jgi:hypothetical protein